MNEMTHLNLPERDRSRSASPADSLTSSATDISMLPIAGRSSHKRDDYERNYGIDRPKMAPEKRISISKKPRERECPSRSFRMNVFTSSEMHDVRDDRVGRDCVCIFIAF
ncbi:uncharacterized protein CDAR_450601 [Caerostris darwini]|uniref:Uncharacterized protein n=1 Tax=Caerostris darwini TaxID=1538125 RepID=A0AAV4P4H4_9ARAC|nr:uncharacterized protein CDAR_450601 [Caerostris darwini]